MIMILGNNMLLEFDKFYREDACFVDNFDYVYDDDVYDGDGDNVDDADHLLVEVDGSEASGCGNDAEQVEDPVQLNF